MEYIVFFAAIFLFFAGLIIKGAFDARKEKERFIRSLYENYGELPKKEYAPGKLLQSFTKGMKEKASSMILPGTT